MTAREMILKSYENGHGIAMTASQTHEAANWILDRMAIEELILRRFVGTFENYEWTDARAAIDLMNAEVITLRKECAIELSRRNSLHRILIQVCEVLECNPPDSNGFECAPLLEALTARVKPKGENQMPQPKLDTIENKCAAIVALDIQLHRCASVKERIKASGYLIAAVESLSQAVDKVIEESLMQGGRLPDAAGKQRI